MFYVFYIDTLFTSNIINTTLFLPIFRIILSYFAIHSGVKVSGLYGNSSISKNQTMIHLIFWENIFHLNWRSVVPTVPPFLGALISHSTIVRLLSPIIAFLYLLRARLLTSSTVSTSIFDRRGDHRISPWYVFKYSLSRS